MTIKPLYPSSDPTLDLNFAGARALDPRVTFTRSSVATRVGPDGLLQTVAPNVARFDHSPTTRESLGLLVEEPRTNSIRNSTCVGAVAGTPGTLPTNWSYAVPGSGLARSVIGNGIENGVNYVDIRINGTATSTTGVSIGIDRAAATIGQSWTASAYLKLAGGSTAGIVSWNILIGEAGASNLFLAGADYPVPIPSGSLVRSAVTRTLTAAATAFADTAIRIFCTNGAAIDFTLRIGLPQLEQGAFVTSAIPTSTGTATRTADIASITGTAFSSFYNQTEGTVYSEGGFASAPLAGGNRFAGLIAINDGTLNNYIGDGLRVLPGFSRRDFAPEIYVAGVQQFAQESNNTAENASAKFSIAYKANDCNAAFSVGPVNTTDTSVTIPTVTQMQLGVGRGGTVVNGHIRRLAYWPRRLPNAMLQAITS